MSLFSPDIIHDAILAERKPIMAFDESCAFEEYQKAVREKLTELLGDMPEYTEPEIFIEWEKEHKGYTEKRFRFISEKFDNKAVITVPCHLLIPHDVPKPCPVVICLQGHSSGMHVSMGRAASQEDERLIAVDENFGMSALAQGYAVLCMEQRAFGERKSDRTEGLTTCHHPAMNALLIGRTIIGERVWDVSRAIDVLETFPEIDHNKIACMGNSGGGTATYYSACVDKRIKVVMPSCCVCAYKKSIGAMEHCVCNYIPKISKYFDMGELSCLIVPRPLIVIAGNNDPIFPIEGPREVFDVIKKIYAKAGHRDKCRLVVGEGEHRFFANEGWKAFVEICGW